MVVYGCKHCGKKYNHRSGLYRHYGTCPGHLEEKMNKQDGDRYTVLRSFENLKADALLQESSPLMIRVLELCSTITKAFTKEIQRVNKLELELETLKHETRISSETNATINNTNNTNIVNNNNNVTNTIVINNYLQPNMSYISDQCQNAFRKWARVSQT